MEPQVRVDQWVEMAGIHFIEEHPTKNLFQFLQYPGSLKMLLVIFPLAAMLNKAWLWQPAWLVSSNART